MKVFRSSVAWGLGWFALCCLAGCNKPAEPQAGGGHEDHHHHGVEAGPHKGILIELGDKEEYHAELLSDDREYKVTIYILDGKGEKNVPIEQSEINLKLKEGTDVATYKLSAAPIEGEKDGKTSRYELINEELTHGFGKKGQEIQFNVAIGKQPFIGSYTFTGKEFSEEHDGHDHDKEQPSEKK